MLEEQVRKDPERTALRWRKTSIRWGQLSAAVRARADDLERAGVGAGDGVAILLPNSPDFVVSLLAAASLGAIAIPFDPSFRKREIEARLAGVRLGAIICTPEGSERCTAISQARARDRDPAVPVFVSEPDLKLPAEASVASPRPAASPDLPVLYGFSSGTTGTAKRIARTQTHLAREAEAFTATAGIRPDDRILGVVPFFHAHGLGNCILAALRAGATLVILERFERSAVLDAIQTERVTIFPTVPFQLQNLTARDSDADLSSVRLCFTAGTALPVATFERVRDCFSVEVRQLYGCTEAGSVCINLSENVAVSCESVGRPIEGIEIAILDAEGRSCPTGVVGEIALRSPAAGCGYAGLDALNRDVFRDGWFRTGDLGVLDAEGRLFVRGRTKLFIDAPAGKVDPVELERCVAGHSSVIEAAAVGVPARGGAEIVKLVVAVGDSWQGDERALRREIVALCREELAEYKLPRIIEPRVALPRNAAGKMLRSKLVEANPARPGRPEID